MEASKDIKDRIKTWEGFRTIAYRCPAGVLTIGYGHTGDDVREGDTIAHKEADELFEQDIAKFERELKQSLTTKVVKKLTQGQYDALLSFAFNIGITKFNSSTLRKKVMANPSDPTIGAEFCKWIYGGGNVLPGLVKRRCMEANIYRGQTRYH